MTAEIDYTIYDLCSILDGQWLSKRENNHLDYISLDSRRISDPASTVFWALSTANRNASSFIPELFKQGVRNFVTEIPPDKKVMHKSNVFLVKDSLKALHQLAIFHRKKFPDLKVIGITGSNGKTIVKEWLTELLSKDFSIVKSPRSFNSQIGVPLSILQIRSHHQIGIFEAGISKPGEMAELEKMIKPEIGVITNIGSAHDEGFQGRQQKIQEKLLLFRESKLIVFPTVLSSSIQSPEMNFNPQVKLLSWGKNEGLLKFSTVKKGNKATLISVLYQRKNYHFQIPFDDKASIGNAVSCFSSIEALNAINAELLKRFQSLSSISMRLEMKPGVQQCSIINDSYNNDLQSLAIALEFLNRQKHKSHTLILSDILESGMTSKELYGKVATLMHRKKIDRFIGIGTEISKERSLFSTIPKNTFFRDTESFLKSISKFHFRNEAILLKGARIFRFEKISRMLEAQLHQTVLTINLSNLADNIRVYRQFLKPETKLMVMVKALAYGSGSNEIASVMEFIKADYLTVAYIDEGVALREAGIILPIMVLNVEQAGFHTMVHHQIEPEIYSMELLEAFSDFLSEQKVKHYPIHIKVDTGMHRLGFVNSEIAGLIRKLKSLNTVKVTSVFSHLSSSDNPDHDAFSKEQFSLLKKVASRLGESLSYHFNCHISNSGAISRFPEFQMDMVRLGIGMYGIDNNPKITKQLKIVHKLTATISQVKKVKKGEVVGYGRNRIDNDKTIATVGIGYADGYPRLLSNGKGKMFLHGKLAPVVGSICMDMTMIDITGIRGVETGDEVEIFGENIPIQKVAKWAGTIPYEIITRISTRVKRIYTED